MSVFARLAVFTHIMTDCHNARHWTAALTGRGRKIVGFQLLVLEVGCIWKMCPKKSVQKGLSKGAKVLQNSPLIPLAVTLKDNCVIVKKCLLIALPQMLPSAATAPLLSWVWGRGRSSWCPAMYKHIQRYWILINLVILKKIFLVRICWSSGGHSTAALNALSSLIYTPINTGQQRIPGSSILTFHVLRSDVKQGICFFMD